MGLSRTARIKALLVIDTAFFFLELIVGYWVGSLALVADSFHMLNDILSLIVALYTIRLATSPSSAKNSYGWQRAEILGALINGVFLIALCSTIGLEALGRMISPPEISNPKLIVIVGSLGLLSNIVGLALFHEHGHSHGGAGHSHDTPSKPKKKTGPIALPPDEEDAAPVPVPRKRSDSISSLHLYQHPAETRAQIIHTAQSLDNQESGFHAMSPPSHSRHASFARGARSSPAPRNRHRLSIAQAPAPGSNETIAPHKGVTAASSETAVATSSAAVSPTTETAPVVPAAPPAGHAHDASDAERGVAANGHDHEHDDEDGHDHGHGAVGGHSHGSMNMHGVFLHVLGDALGNIGVISAGLVIWFFEGRWTLYFDPGVSLLITVIIFSSAMPLVKSASSILMQGVPQHVSLDDVRNAIKRVDGVVSVHELHVWQLSETTSVASVHVLILPGYDYMEVANEIRSVMHAKGIHSVTIQPEFFTASRAASDDGSIEESCLIRCPPDQCEADTCCPPGTAPATAPGTGSTTTPLLSHVSEGDEHSNHSGHAH